MNSRAAAPSERSGNAKLGNCAGTEPLLPPAAFASAKAYPAAYPQATSPAMTQLPLVIRPEEPSDAAAIERLHERAFGPGRFARTAFRLREGVPHSLDLSFT